MTKINLRRIYGHFLSGVALDVQTTGSRYIGVDELGHDVYDPARTEVGDLLYRLKYRADREAGAELVRLAAEFLAGYQFHYDVLVPVPPSGVRALQPVRFLADGVAAAVPLPLADCITTTRATASLEGVTDPVKRMALLEDLYAVDSRQTEGKDVLLFDDLFRTGSTLDAIADLLMDEGGAKTVRALTIAKTRGHL